MVEGIFGKNQNVDREVRTRTARIWLDEDGILRIVSLPGSEETLEDAESCIAVIHQLTGSQKRPILIDPGFQKSMSREARIYYVRNASSIAVAIAGLMKSPYARILANFYVGLNKVISEENYALNFFTSEKKAKEWLKMYVI